MTATEEDRGQFAPAHTKDDGSFVVIVHADRVMYEDSLQCPARQIEELERRVFEALKGDCNAVMLAMDDAIGTGTGWAGLCANEIGAIDRLNVRRVSPDEFRQDYPPAWPANVQPARPGKSGAQWKREKNRYRGRSG